MKTASEIFDEVEMLVLSSLAETPDLSKNSPYHETIAEKKAYWLESKLTVEAGGGECQCSMDNSEHHKQYAGKRCTNCGRMVRPLPTPAPPPGGEGEKQYPCDTCGKLRTKAQGGTTFTLCDECWDAYYKSKQLAPAPSAPDKGEQNSAEAEKGEGEYKKRSYPIRDAIINIIITRVNEAFSDGYHKHEHGRLMDALHAIKELIPPDRFSPSAPDKGEQNSAPKEKPGAGSTVVLNARKIDEKRILEILLYCQTKMNEEITSFIKMNQ